MTPRARFLRKLAADTQYAHGAQHGFVCAARLKLLLDALEAEAVRYERRPAVLLPLLSASLALLSGVALGALIFT